MCGDRCTISRVGSPELLDQLAVFCGQFIVALDEQLMELRFDKFRRL
jgi:hypothetical protein